MNKLKKLYIYLYNIKTEKEMKRLILIFGLLSILVTGCKKKSIEPEQTTNTTQTNTPVSKTHVISYVVYYAQGNVCESITINGVNTTSSGMTNQYDVKTGDYVSISIYSGPAQYNVSLGTTTYKNIRADILIDSVVVSSIDFPSPSVLSYSGYIQ